MKVVDILVIVEINVNLRRHLEMLWRFMNVVGHFIIVEIYVNLRKDLEISWGLIKVPPKVRGRKSIIGKHEGRGQRSHKSTYFG